MEGAIPFAHCQAAPRKGAGARFFVNVASPYQPAACRPVGTHALPFITGHRGTSWADCYQSGSQAGPHVAAPGEDARHQGENRQPRMLTDRQK